MDDYHKPTKTAKMIAKMDNKINRLQSEEGVRIPYHKGVESFKINSDDIPKTYHKPTTKED